MKNCVYIVLLFLFQLQNLNSQTGWFQQPVNTRKHMTGVCFLNVNTGWVVGDSGIILKTTNGGANWIKSVYDPMVFLFSVNFINTTTGWIGGFVNSHLAGFLLRTTTGGNQWNVIGMSEPYEIFTFRGDTIWCSTHTGVVARSTNRGDSWNFHDVLPGLELYTVFFINPKTGWTGGGVYQEFGYIYKSTDGGFSWFNQLISLTHHIKSIYFVNESTGYAVTWHGYIYKTTTGGLDWTILTNNVNNTLFSVKFPAVNTGYAAGTDNKIFKTTNAGLNWSIQAIPPNIPPYMTYMQMRFVSPTTGWVVGHYGTILKTTNGGEPIGIKPIGNLLPSQFMLYQNYPNPFNPSTYIKFDNPKTGSVKVAVYELSGKEVSVIVNETLQPGSYEVNFETKNLSSGVYFYSMITDEYTETKKMILIK